MKEKKRRQESELPDLAWNILLRDIRDLPTEALLQSHAMCPLKTAYFSAEKRIFLQEKALPIGKCIFLAGNPGSAVCSGG